MTHARPGAEGLGTVVTRALALAAIAGGLGLVHSLFADPVRLTLAPNPVQAVLPAVAEPAGSEPGSGGAAAEPDATAARAAPPESPQPEPVAKAGTLSAAEAFALYESGAQFIDARRLEEYEAGHVLGAHRVTAGEMAALTDGATALLDALDPAATTVIYCVGGDCKDSENLGILLQGVGFTDVRIMGAGYDDWAAAGYPTEAGSGGTP